MTELQGRIIGNLDNAKPRFLEFVDNMTPKLSMYIMYAGYEVRANGVFFTFKSSQNSLNFTVYGGVVFEDKIDILSMEFEFISEYFRIINKNSF